DNCGPKIAACSPGKERAERGDAQRVGDVTIPYHIGWSRLRSDEIFTRSLELRTRQQADRHETNAERDDHREECLAIALEWSSVSKAETRVYLLRGWFGIFSTGLDTLAE